MNRLRSPWAVVGVVVAVLLAANLGLRELDQATRPPGGPTSSSFATAPEGVAAYAELLGRFDRPVLRLRETPAEAELEPDSTLVLLDAEGVTRDDADAIGGLLRSGGRLLYAGAEPGWLRRVNGERLVWKPSFADRGRVPPGAAGLGDVETVEAEASGVWVSDEGVLLAAANGALALRRPVGRGEAVLLSDASPLHNRLLASADNAAFGLAVAGPRGRPVVFAESFHGYGEASGLEAVPSRWWWVLGGLALAAVVLALARGRRLGPPELPGRELPPARAEFAEALATQLARTRPHGDALRTARRLVRERLVRAVRLPPDAPETDVRAAAAARRIDAEIVDAALGGERDSDDLLAVGRALRELERMEVA